MATRGTLTAYLLLCIHTLRGHWARPGQQYNQSAVLTPPRTVRAQPEAPRQGWGMGEPMRASGFPQSVAGLPAALLPDEILTPGEGKVRALFCHVGAALSMPDQHLTERALSDLDLMITHDVQETPTSRMAHYVFAASVSFETPAMTVSGEYNSKLHHGYGWNEPYAAYYPALVSAPHGSDVLDPWRVYYRLGQALDYRIDYGRSTPVPLDMDHEPTTEELYGYICTGSKVPLDEVKAYPDGHVFEEAAMIVEEREVNCTARLRLDDPHMMAELAEIAGEDYAAARSAIADYPFLLIPRRVQNTTNSMVRVNPDLQGARMNPAYLHPDDLEELGISDGDLVTVTSRNGAIDVAVQGDATLRRGVLAITHGFGRSLADKGDPRIDGANVNRLISLTEELEPYSGMPRMGAIPVAVQPA